MQFALNRELYNSLFNRLMASKNELDLTQDFIQKHINSPYFVEQIKHMTQNQDYSCQSVFVLCEKMLIELWKDALPRDPLYYIYQFALHQSFPNAVEMDFQPQLSKGCFLYLRVLEVVCEFEKKGRGPTWQSKYPLNFLSPQELSCLKDPEEYQRFTKAFQREHVYEMMKLNQEVVGHNTLDHICGVHHLATSIGRQLYDRGVPVDLGRVSGGAAGHDIGKYGCNSNESSRVAYLHYYYTDLWFKKHQITYIGHIALNHSVWDLELENLSLESLILIYCDFRVKNGPKQNGKYVMTVYSLTEAFDVILNKLDNVDEEKHKRYQRVYGKLKDFEDYLVHLGIIVDMDHFDHRKEAPFKPPIQHYSLMQGDDVIQHLKYTSIDYNIGLMHRLRDDAALNELIEVARGELDPRILREFLDIFEEYSIYLTQKQKLITLRFLYEKLIHPEEDIRRQCAQLIGSLIGAFDEDYRKELPKGVQLPPENLNSTHIFEEYFKAFVFPDHKIIPLHRNWIQSNMSTMVSSLFIKCKESQKQYYIESIGRYYNHTTIYEVSLNVNLLKVIQYIVFDAKDPILTLLLDYIDSSLYSHSMDIRITALEITVYLLDFIKKHPAFYRKIFAFFQENTLPSPIPAENYLKYKVAKALPLEKKLLDNYESFYATNATMIPDIFLSNLKTATNWVTKKIHVDLLLQYACSNEGVNRLHTAMHFCNLLKVSAVENVRRQAGEALIKILPHLPLEQRNDIAVELLRALEIEGVQFTKYIPNYLGQVLIYLQPIELDEIIVDFIDKGKQSNFQVTALLLKTVGVLLSNYPKYKKLFMEEEEIYHNRLNTLLGILLNGLAHRNVSIRQMAFSVIGKMLFGSKRLCLEDQLKIFQRIGKKVLTLLHENMEKDALFLTNAASLIHIYRFISDYTFFKGVITISSPKKIAFFPGSFDPFTLSHKEICKAIRDLGFEVYLAVDEFSWSKRTQPNLIRRSIINMSIADQMHIYLYPESLPTNIANNADLLALKERFQGLSLYIVVGSDVITNASAYRGDRKENFILSFPHIIFDRHSGEASQEEDTVLDQVIGFLTGDVIRLNLPPQYEDISSTQIRNYVDENRDITNLIDPLAQKYIYENRLYRKEPQYKSLVQTISIDIQLLNELDSDIAGEIVHLFHQDNPLALENLLIAFQKPKAKMIVLRDLHYKNRIVGYSIFHWLPSDQIYQEFKNAHISDCIRDHYQGRIIVIDGLFTNPKTKLKNVAQILLTETLVHCLKNDYGYGIFSNKIDPKPQATILEVLELNGFQILPCSDILHPVLAVDMNNPCTLNLDIEMLIKEPFRSRPNVEKVLATTRKKYQRALTNLYPGNLVLSFDHNIIDETLIKKICAENNVPTTPTVPRKLGPLMCVPFGNILGRSIVPNTVTKALHVERLFSPDMKSFDIGPFPYYLDLESQAKMIKSFNRPVILIDDLLNKGYRLKVLDPILKNTGVEVKKILVGILSGRGKELLEIQDREVDCAYFIPKLRLWFNESISYPFIGGDTLWRGTYPEKSLLPSVNLILPYTSPSFIKNVSNESLYELSYTCIENAMKILQTLEVEYQKINERKLTLSSLGEVFLHPRCPDQGNHMHYDLKVNPSHYLQNDLEKLTRLKYIINK